MLHPGQSIRPHLSQQMAMRLVQRLYGLKDIAIVELNGYDDKNYHVKICGDRNESRLWAHGFVLKVMNSLDSQKLPLIEAQTEIALYLDSSGQKHVVRLLTYQPGKLLKEVPCTKQLMLKVGKFVAEIDHMLKGFHHPAYDNNKSVWSLESVPLLRKFTFSIQDAERNALVNTIIDAFETAVVSVFDAMEKGLIHGDFNEQNVVVGANPSDCSWDIAAVLDFGDTQHSCYLFELAICICYMMLLAADSNPLDVGGHVIAGYSMVRTLPDVEFSILKICVSARLCQSLVLGAYSYLQDPGNEYLLTTSQKGWDVLQLIWNTPNNDLMSKWKETVTSYQE
ncbi:hydroxylysine kinase isoform X3 [Cryptotermes secundus]|uniref:hydroxylysine kinase isoform X3 n=1 Tax=Cryptotermes secundus TaxID=105785 RepID=UPI000CD7B2A0|nr:hydroxylysine kinase isoform X3 [Cryptotermes secundus]